MLAGGPGNHGLIGDQVGLPERGSRSNRIGSCKNACIAERRLAFSVRPHQLDLRIGASDLEENWRAEGRRGEMEAGGEGLRSALRGVGRNGGGRQHQ
jgi:hypothetical protein